MSIGEHRYAEFQATVETLLGVPERASNQFPLVEDIDNNFARQIRG